MQNPAYQLDLSFEDETRADPRRGAQNDTDLCPACGQELFGSDAEACSWQSWGTFWEILGLSHVELVCGECGEYLRGFFDGGRK
jgi:hypothetical protein